MKGRKKTPEILNRGSLMTYRDGDRENCFGYMFDFPGHGVFEPTFGKLDVSAAEAKTHNEYLSQGEIEGLDKNCIVGLGGLFYIRKNNGRSVVTTWLGQEISQEVQIRGQAITFTRKSMSFRGRLRQDEDCFWFKRIQ